MNIFKKISIFLSILISSVLIVAALLPRTYEVTRSIEIKTNSTIVFENVADYSIYKKWNWLSKQDPMAVIEIKGKLRQKGSSYSWDGRVIGIGSLTLVNVEPGKMVENTLTYKKPFESIAKDYWTFETTDKGTKVNWVNSGKLSYPMGAFIVLGINKRLSPQMDSGLVSLKTFSEMKNQN